MQSLILTIYLFVAAILIFLVMIQESKDGGMGGLGGGNGAANTVFGSSGSGNFMTRLTTIVAIIFFILCLVLGNFSTKNRNVPQSSGEFDNIGTTEGVPQQDKLPPVLTPKPADEKPE